jgi:signal transduction histidine kinase
MISATRSPESSTSKSESEILFSNLSDGLHATAQPLTILRASLSEAQIDPMSRDELRELAVRSSVEVERVCTLFRCLQQILNIGRFKPNLSATPILPLIADVAGGVDLVFERDGMFLSSIVPETCQPVQIDPARTHQALSIVLLIAHRVSQAQDTIELFASSPSARVVRIVVRNRTSNVDTVDSQMHLSMALAEANIRSQRASFSWRLKPFKVQIELPAAAAIPEF